MLLAIGCPNRGVQEHEADGALNGAGDLHGRWIVNRGREIGWHISVASTGRGVSHPPVDRPVLGVGAPHRGFPQGAQ